MTTTKDLVKQTVTLRLKALHLEVPADTDSYIEEVEQSILNYCGIGVVPTELRYVWSNMSIDYLRWIGQLSSPEKHSTPTVLTSLKEGDTTLGFSADTSGAHSFQAVLDQVVMNYADQLNRFRRVVW